MFHALNRLFLSSRGHASARTMRKACLSLESLEERTLLSASTPAAVMGVVNQQAALGGLVYSPAQIRSAYGLSGTNFGKTAADGKGQTIAIVDPFNDPNLLNDLDSFDRTFGATSSGSTLFKQYGAASSFLSVFNQSGKAFSPAKSSVAADPTGGWEQELALDVEWAHAVAPGAKIDVVETNSASTKDLLAGVAAAAKLPGVSVVSMNWGISEESGESAFDSTFTTPSGHQGVTFLAPTGDTGAPGSYPAYSPDVVAVGGTNLLLNANGQIQSETAWTGSGGGISTQEAEPAYQLAVQNTGHRTIPDVAFDANIGTGVFVYDSYLATASTTWKVLGGSSLGTPAWAGMMAIVNQGRVQAGGTTLNSGGSATQADSALYGVSSSDFHDITSGSNRGFNAGAGYDEVTGRGSPVANRLIPDLVNYQTGTHLVVSSQPPSSLTPGATFSVTVKAVDKAGNVVTGFNGNVTLVLANNPGGSVLGGKVTVAAVKGVAIFTGLSLNKAGIGYTLKATSGTLSAATTNAITEAAGTVSRVATPLNAVAVAMDDYYDNSGDYSDYGNYGDYGNTYYADNSYSNSSYDSGYYASNNYGSSSYDYGYGSAAVSSPVINSVWNGATGWGLGTIGGAILGAGLGITAAWPLVVGGAIGFGIGYGGSYMGWW
jgi:subtilase family serine protease